MRLSSDSLPCNAGEGREGAESRWGLFSVCLLQLASE